MFTIVVSYKVRFIVLLLFSRKLVEETRVLDFWRENQKEEIVKGRGDEPSLNETIVQR